jgi:23S rRNA pseudouridine2605 synthase
MPKRNGGAIPGGTPHNTRNQMTTPEDQGELPFEDNANPVEETSAQDSPAQEASAEETPADATEFSALEEEAAKHSEYVPYIDPESKQGGDIEFVADYGGYDKDGRPLSDFVEDDTIEEVAPVRLVRLNKYMAANGIASRRRADELIANREVSVDGQIVSKLGTKIDPATQRVEWDGHVLKPEGTKHRYYLLNKPTGVVCTNDEKELRRRAWDLISDPEKGRVYPVGRLDVDSSGLLILTNDGEFTHRVTHPSYGVEKTYEVTVKEFVSDAAILKIGRGLHLAEGRTVGAGIVLRQRNDHMTKMQVTLTEGKNREVRRIFARFGYRVKDLHREAISAINDRGMGIGQWRFLTEEEVAALMEASSVKTAPPKHVRRQRREYMPDEYRDSRGRNTGYSGPKGGPGDMAHEERKEQRRAIGTIGDSPWNSGGGRRPAKDKDEKPVRNPKTPAGQFGRAGYRSKTQRGGVERDGKPADAKRGGGITGGRKDKTRQKGRR